MRKGGLRTEETVKDVNGRLLRGNEARKRWAEYFEELLNVQEDREADIVAVGSVQVTVMGEENEREIIIEVVKRALNETKAMDWVIACMVPLYKGKEICMNVVILGV